MTRLTAIRRRVRTEGGFTVIVALAVLMVVTLLTAAAFAAVGGDVTLTAADVNGKQAYAAAQAGVQAYLYALNSNSASSQWWENCANDSAGGTLPGAAGVRYAYAPVPANGTTACSSANPMGTIIDAATGTLRIQSTGWAGTAHRTIVASFRTLSPLSYMWYTVHETEDPSVGGSECSSSAFYYSSPPPPAACDIYWVTGDTVNGPLYTQDQLLIPAGNTPTFGRTSQDVIASQVPTSGANDICVNSNCQNDPNIVGTRQPNVTPQVPLPSDNTNLLSDATAHGKVYTGVVTLHVTGTTATGWNCTSSSSCTQIGPVDLTRYPIIYARNATGCAGTYDPQSVSYASYTSSPGGSSANGGAYYGQCGDVYVSSGSYTTPLTIAAANNVIVTGSLTTTEDATGTPTGTATLGLVANQYVRVKHDCSGNPDVTIDGSILTLSHSFFVDNYGCGGTPLGTLTVHGAIAQKYRGIVGTVDGSGYLKNYWYDNRLAVMLPPYLFDLQNTQWTVFRQTLCPTTTSAAGTVSCAS